VRKSVVDLTAADFLESAVWEFALDEEGEEGQDETTVRPYQVDGPLDSSTGMFVVRAQFALADGSTMSGYLTPPEQGDDSISTLQPIIITPSGQVVFWCGMIEPSRADSTEATRALGSRLPTRYSPLRFESATPLRAGALRAEIPGFIVLEDFQTGRTRIML
jgi:hypothetical protein